MTVISHYFKLIFLYEFDLYVRTGTTGLRPERGNLNVQGRTSRVVWFVPGEQATTHTERSTHVHKSLPRLAFVAGQSSGHSSSYPLDETGGRKELGKNNDRNGTVASLIKLFEIAPFIIYH